MSRQSLVLVELLDRGSHPDPRRGGCFMEVAGSLHGGPWTAQPPCTPRVLAAVARRVNDASREPAPLAPLMPWVIDTRPDDWHELDLAVGDAALPVTGRDERMRLTAATDLTRSRLASCAVARPSWRRRARWRADAHRLVALAFTATVEHSGDSGDSRDRRLRQLLITGIEETRTRRGLPPLDMPELSAQMCAVKVPVLTELIAPRAGIHCTWPAPRSWRAGRPGCRTAGPRTDGSSPGAQQSRRSRTAGSPYPSACSARGLWPAK